jgi:hypothetical protein
MKLSRVMRLGIAAVICLFVHTPGVRAQGSPTGILTGTVTDPSGAITDSVGGPRVMQLGARVRF